MHYTIIIIVAITLLCLSLHHLYIHQPFYVSHAIYETFLSFENYTVSSCSAVALLAGDHCACASMRRTTEISGVGGGAREEASRQLKRHCLRLSGLQLQQQREESGECLYIKGSDSRQIAMDPLLTDEGGAVHASTATTADPRENSATGAEVVIQPPAIAALKEEAASLAGRRGSGGSSQRSLATLPKSYSEVQLPAELHPALLLERSRRVRAEQQVEAERQTCLELTRLLELERRKVRQQTRRPSTIADSVAAARRDSAGIIVSFGGKREEEEGSLHHGQSGREGGIDKGEGYDRREVANAI